MPIHPTTLIHPSLQLPPDLEIGPYSVVDEGIKLGNGVRIGPFCHLYPGVRLGDGVSLSDGVVLGNTPQDLKYRGEKTLVEIGSGTVLREYVTVNRGTAATGKTSIGSNCLIMAYTHVAHDCSIGDNVIIANGVQMGGHVSIGSASVISGMTGIHQFTTIGPGVFVGGGLRVDKDIPPFSKAMGEPLAWAGVNEIGLEKMGFGDKERKELKEFYRRINGVGSESVAKEFADHHALMVIFREFYGKSSRGLVGRRESPH